METKKTTIIIIMSFLLLTLMMSSPIVMVACKYKINDIFENVDNPKIHLIIFDIHGNNHIFNEEAYYFWEYNCEDLVPTFRERRDYTNVFDKTKDYKRIRKTVLLFFKKWIK